MRKLFLVFGVLIGLVSLNVPSYALTGSGSSNKTLFQNVLFSSATNGNTAFVNGANPNGVLLSLPGQPITGLVLSGGTSGGIIALYDANNTGVAANTGSDPTQFEAGAQECIFEATMGANTTTYLDLHDAPINALRGVVAVTSSTAGVVVYSSKGIASNQ